MELYDFEDTFPRMVLLVESDKPVNDSSESLSEKSEFMVWKNAFEFENDIEIRSFLVVFRITKKNLMDYLFQN